MRILNLLIILLAFGGCAASHHKLYEGPIRSSAEIAILTSNEGMDSFQVRGIDGTEGPGMLGYSSKINGAYHIELLPGNHTIRGLVVHSPLGSFTRTAEFIIPVTLEAGKKYTIQGEKKLDRGLKALVWLQDLTNNERVSDILTSRMSAFDWHDPVPIKNPDKALLIYADGIDILKIDEKFISQSSRPVFSGDPYRRLELSPQPHVVEARLNVNGGQIKSKESLKILMFPVKGKKYILLYDYDGIDWEAWIESVPDSKNEKSS